MTVAAGGRGGGGSESICDFPRVTQQAEPVGLPVPPRLPTVPRRPSSLGCASKQLGFTAHGPQLLLASFHPGGPGPGTPSPPSPQLASGQRSSGDSLWEGGKAQVSPLPALPEVSPFSGAPPLVFKSDFKACSMKSSRKGPMELGPFLGALLLPHPPAGDWFPQDRRSHQVEGHRASPALTPLGGVTLEPHSSPVRGASGSPLQMPSLRPRGDGACPLHTATKGQAGI